MLEKIQRAKAKADIHPRNDYQPLDWQIAPLNDRSKVLLLTGSAGGGKSRLAAEKIHRNMLKYPGATGLVVRKAREFVTKSAVPLLQGRVIGSDNRVRILKSESHFQYTNGSRIYWGGLRDEDQQEALKSMGQDGAFDFIWAEEANALTEQDYMALLSRLRGTATDWRQIILSTNPDAPMHWIKRRLIDGKEASTYYSSAIDNPNNPPDYLETLDLLTGIQRLRLVEGLWVQAEGVIYDRFDSEFNVTFEADYRSDLDVYWGVDDGYANGDGPGTAGHHPRVILLGQMWGDGTVAIFDEYYETLQLPEASIKDVLSRPYRAPILCMVDSSATELRRRLSDVGLLNGGATHRVSEGIKVVRRFIEDGHGVRQLLIHPRCINLIRELQTYRYDDRSKLVEVGEPKPMKIDDHAPDALRYLLWQFR